MTVTTTTSRISYAGNGSTTAFSVPFYFLAAADLVVIRATAAGAQATLVLNTDYTVTGAGAPAGGTVTCSTAPAVGDSLVIFRAPAETQTTDYQPNDPFPAETHERALDKLTMIAQRLKDLISRSFTLSDGDTSNASTQLPTPTANRLIGWNGSASGLQNVDPANLLTIAGSSGFRVQIFSGTGSQTFFNISENPGLIDNLEVFVGGVRQVPGINYTLATTPSIRVNFFVAPPAGTNNILVRWGQTFIINAPADGSVTPSKMGFNQGPSGFEQLAGFRNRLINGKMQVRQRGAAALLSGVDVYTADRWFYRATGAAPTAVSYAGFGGRLADALNITGNSGLTKLVVGQRIESINCLSIYNANNLTVSAVMRNSPSGSRVVTANFYAANSTDNFSSKTLLASSTAIITNAVATFSFLLSPTSIASSTGYELEFDFGAVDASTTVGITAVQIENGTVATQFEDRSYGTELALCQRYYQEVGDPAAADVVWRFYASDTSFYYLPMPLPVKMRATPTATVAGTWSTTNVTSVTVTASASAFRLNVNPTAVGAAVVQNSGANARLTFAIEL